MKPEQILHNSVASFLSVALCPPTWWVTFPAGGGGKIRGAFLKRMGLRPGVPDLMILHNGGNFWIELKSASGRLSAEQIAAGYAITQAGGHVAICRSLDEVIGSLRGWSIPTRAVLGAGRAA